MCAGTGSLLPLPRSLWRKTWKLFCYEQHRWLGAMSETRAATGVQQPQRTIKVGLDFGTYSSGFCYSINDQPVARFEHYPDQPTPYPKTRTALLYKRETPSSEWQVNIVDWGSVQGLPSDIAVYVLLTVSVNVEMPIFCCARTNVAC